MTTDAEPLDLTVAIIKPDAVRRGLIGHILDRAAHEGSLIPVDLRMDTMTPLLAGKFYEAHREAPYFEELIDFMCDGTCVYVLFHGFHACIVWRAMLGATDPAKAQLGTLRRLYGTGGPANVGHGADSPEAVEREMKLLGLHSR